MDTKLSEDLSGIKGQISTFITEHKAAASAMQRQIDAVDLNQNSGNRLSNGPGGKSFVDLLKESEPLGRLMHDKRGTAIVTLSGRDASDFLQRKATITQVGVGYQQTGVMPIERIPGITAEGRQELTVRDVLYARPTEASVVDFVKVTTPLGLASPVAETFVKPENAVNFGASSERVKTIATWIPASRQVLDDWAELAMFLQTSLSYYVGLEEESQILSGDATGENLHGLIPQASTFNTLLLSESSGWNKIDIIGYAISQLTSAKEIPPTFVVMHPTDWWATRMLKDSFGRYLIGDPQSTARANLFDLTVVPTVSIAQGTFLVGSGNPAACEIRDRMELQFEVSTSHADYFTRNLVACRAEKRLALVVKRGASYVTGTFNSSPA